MSQQVKKYSEIDFDKDDILDQLNKRFKRTKQEVIDDIASSVESIAESTKSIGENHAIFLEVNKALTSFLLETKKQNQEESLAVTDSTSSIRDRLEYTPVESPK